MPPTPETRSRRAATPGQPSARAPSTSFSLASSYLVHLADLVAARGATRDALYRGLVPDPAQLSAPRSWTPSTVLDPLVERAIALGDEPALAIVVGLSMQLSWHGFAGFAGLSASTLGQAIELAVDYGRTVCPEMTMEFVRDGHDGVLHFRLGAGHSPARDFVMLATVVGYATMGRALAGRPIDGVATVDVARPAGMERFAADLACPVVFGGAENSLRVHGDTLAASIRTADAGALALARAQCEETLRAFSESRPFTKRVRELAVVPGGYRTMDDVARHLAVSSRHLHRQLRAEGSTYAAIVDGLRHARALELLGDRRSSISDVAYALGYSDVANFNRAFHRWRGLSPRAYRAGS